MGRYDVFLSPKNTSDRGIVIEFKTMKSKNEKNIKETCINALRQIKNCKYTNELIERGVSKSNIYIYGFAFHGKKSLICGGMQEEVHV